MTAINEVVASSVTTKQYTTVSLGATIQGCVYSRDGTASSLSTACSTACDTGSCAITGSSTLPGAITNSVCGGGYQNGESECLLINLVAPVNKPDDVTAMSVRSNDGEQNDPCRQPPSRESRWQPPETSLPHLPPLRLRAWHGPARLAAACRCDAPFSRPVHRPTHRAPASRFASTQRHRLELGQHQLRRRRP